jgi:hypothetical protein
LRATVAQSVFARITLRDEIARYDIVDFDDINLCSRTGAGDADDYSAAASLSGGVAELR